MIIVSLSTKSWQSTSNVSVGRQSVTFCWLMSSTHSATGLIDAKQRGSLLERRNIFLKLSPFCRRWHWRQGGEWWEDPASWVSAHTMSSSRPCRLGRCFPGPPTLDHPPPAAHSSAAVASLAARSSSRISPEKPFPLLSVSSSSSSAALVALNDAPRSPRHRRQLLGSSEVREEAVSADPSNRTFGASAAAGPLKAAATMGWISTGGPPPHPRLGRLATSSYFQPHVKQGPRGLKGGARGGQSWARGAGANGRSAKRGNRTVLDCVEPKVWVKEEGDGNKKGEKVVRRCRR